MSLNVNSTTHLSLGLHTTIPQAIREAGLHPTIPQAIRQAKHQLVTKIFPKTDYSCNYFWFIFPERKKNQ